MPHSVFTYGTLQVPAVMAAVTGVQPESEEALLPDHACYRMRRRIYPGAVPSIGCFVNGRLYRNIDDVILEFLDAFEDVLYQRQLLVVKTRDTMVKAQVYIVAEDYRELLSREPWDIGEFMSQHLAHYLESCRRFHQGISGVRKTRDKF